MAIQTADENEEMDSDPDLKNAVSTSYCKYAHYNWILQLRVRGCDRWGL